MFPQMFCPSYKERTNTGFSGGICANTTNIDFLSETELLQKNLFICINDMDLNEKRDDKLEHMLTEPQKFE